MKRIILIIFYFLFILHCSLMPESKNNSNNSNDSSKDNDLFAAELLEKYNEGSITLDEFLNKIAPELKKNKELYEAVISAILEDKDILLRLKENDNKNFKGDDDKDGYINLVELLAGTNIYDKSDKPFDLKIYNYENLEAIRILVEPNYQGTAIAKEVIKVHITLFSPINLNYEKLVVDAVESIRFDPLIVESFTS